MGRVIVICSGKGGTGKSSLTAGLGTALALLGRNTLCIDCDIGLRNLDLALGMADAVLMDFADVMEGRCALTRALVPHPQNQRLSLLTAPLRLPKTLSADRFRSLLDEARTLFDYILIDAPAGLGEVFSLAVSGADEAIVVTTADLGSLRDAQRCTLALFETLPQARLVLNRLSPRLLQRLGMTVDDVMDFVGLPLLGLVPEDPQMTLAAGSGRALLFCADRHKGAALACSNIARRLEGRPVPLMKLR